jgi:signal transduction histidine kinase/ligand-binding sensor domain-containing protein
MWKRNSWIGLNTASRFTLLGSERPECREDTADATGWRLGVRSMITVALCCMFLFCGRVAYGLDPSTHISQYGHTAWRLGESGLDGLPTSITQSSDGYLWVGTTDGLFRFDGIRLTKWTPLAGGSLPNAAIRSVLGARNGSLYVATEAGVARITNGRIYSYPESLRWAGPLLEDDQGRVSTGDWGNPSDSSTLCSIGETHLSCQGMKDGFGCMYGYSLASEKAGSIWIGSDQGICRWRENAPPENYLLPSHGRSDHTVLAMAVDKEGSIWGGISTTGQGAGLLKLTGKEWKTFVTPQVDGRKLAVRSLSTDSSGDLWIGTESQGLYRLSGGKLEHFATTDGLSGDAVKQIFEDREHTLWVVTDRGIDSFNDLPVISFTSREGLSGAPNQLTTSRSGDVWIGASHTLNLLHNRQFFHFTDPFLKREIHYLFSDSHDRIWVGAGQQLLLYEHGRFTPVTDRYGDRVGEVIEMEEDSRHRLWASVQNLADQRGNALIRIQDLRVAESFSSPALADRQIMNVLAPEPGGGLWVAGYSHGLYRFRDGKFDQIKPDGFDGRIADMTSDPDGALWIATPQGAIRYMNGRAQAIKTSNGLPCENVLSVINDRVGAHWLFMQCGILRIRDSEISRWWSNATSQLTITAFTLSDGALPRLRGERPFFSSDGRLWSVNGSSLQMIDPKRLPSNALPPPVHIEHLLVGHTDHPLVGSPTLPVSPQVVEVDYAGLSYVAPAKVRFRYQLAGHDREWTDSGTRRQAFYNDLSPGYYTFRVIACNNDGVWNTQQATIGFMIPPAWYQTIWFKLLCVVVAAMLAYSLYQFRIRQYATMLKVRFDERIEERTRLARDLHDTLLQTIQGSKMVADNALERPNDSARMHKALDLVSTWLERATLEGRAALNSLRSSTVDTNDLAAAFRHAAEDCRIGSTIQVSHALTGTSSDMHPIVRDEIYRIGYEAINNACVHSGGSLMTVELTYNHNVQLRIRDNGKGIGEKTLQSGKTGHFGLEGMRERADRIGAKLSVCTAPDGTEVNLLVPGSVVFKTYRPTKRSQLLKMFAIGRDSSRHTSSGGGAHN